MDNADLESLKLTPGRLNPKFSCNVTEYTVMLSSAATQARVDALTSDSGASCEIVDAGGERVVQLMEGLNPIVIEVSAPDGTIKRYTISVTRLAADLAELSNLTVLPGKLDRAYQKKTSEYYATLGWAVTEVKIKPIKQDPKMVVTIDGNPSETTVKLVSMETTVSISVVSPDKSTTKVYRMHLIKDDSGYRPFPVTDSPDLVCGICSSVCQSPRKLAQCGHFFCAVCLAVVQRTDKSCPGCGKKSPTDPPFDEVDIATRDKSVDLDVKCFYCGKTTKNGELLEHAAQCEKRLVTCDSCYLDVAQVDLEAHQGAGCTGSCKPCGQKYPKQYTEHHTAMCVQGDHLSGVELVHSIKRSAWEKKLTIDNSETFDDLYESGMKHEEAYHKVKTSSDLVVIKEHLNAAAAAYANAIAVNVKSAKAHYRLGVIMEELHYLEDCLLGKTVDKKVSQLANTAAQESSKIEEIDAICQLHGVAGSAPLGDKLRALDKEYHSLKDSGDSFKADRVQGLYAWKSKQGTQAEKSSMNASSVETYLGKASSKYVDAVFLEPTAFHYNYNMGCSYLTQLKFKEAVIRFRVCVGAKPLVKYARYALGIALSHCYTDETEKTEAVAYLTEGIASYQHWISCMKRDGEAPGKTMRSEAGYQLRSSHFLSGWLRLADLTADKTHKMDLLLTLTYLIPRILQSIPVRGEIFLNIEVLLFSSLTKLLDIVEPDLVPAYCNRLSMMISKSPDAGNQKLLELQVDTCRKQVFVQSNNGRALTTLGDALIALFDLTENKDLLKEAEVCYRVAIKVEGIPVKSKRVPEEIQKLQWYQDQSAPKVTPAPAKRGGCGARGGPARGGVRGGAARGGARGAPAARGNAPARGTAPPRGTAPARGTAKQRGGVKCDNAPAPKIPTPPPEDDEDVVSGPTNHSSSTPRLGLARVLGMSDKAVEEQKTLYNEVIKMDQHLHDAYIELGELCRGTMEAVDVYDRFPFSSEPSFDDAFIYGEITQILMKKEEFDDSRLEKALVGYGIVMGWNSLETFVRKLETAYKTKLLRRVYCKVNKKKEEDSDVQNFFRVKLW